MHKIRKILQSLGWRPVATVLIGFCLVSATQALKAADYAIVVSQPTGADPAWSNVVSALAVGRQAVVLSYPAGPIESVLPRLRELFPTRTAFVAQSKEVTREYV